MGPLPYPLSLYPPENLDFLPPAFLERGLPLEAAGVLAPGPLLERPERLKL
jgi:hypothetical protein